MEHTACLGKTVNVHKIVVEIFKMEETIWNIVYSAVAQSRAIRGGQCKLWQDRVQFTVNIQVAACCIFSQGHRRQRRWNPQKHRYVSTKPHGVIPHIYRHIFPTHSRYLEFQYESRTTQAVW